jgi:citrate lyase subunit beta/citryl-CoA lyase
VVGFLKEGAKDRGLPLLVRVRRLPLLVRVNAPGSAWLDEDMDAVVLSGLAGIVLPKAQDAGEVLNVAKKATALAKKRKREPPVLIPTIESALGLIRAFEIASASPLCTALALGGEDFARDIGAVRTPGGGELALARMQVVVAARAAGVLPVDTVFTDFRNQGGLAEEAKGARRIGFAGKLAIHPSQIEVLNRAFTPDLQEIEEARAIVSAFEVAQAKGEAVASLDGKMLDPAVVDQARRIVDLAEEISRLEVAP